MSEHEPQPGQQPYGQAQGQAYAQPYGQPYGQPGPQQGYGSVATEADAALRQRFRAFLALALGVLGAVGGGVLGTAAQWLTLVNGAMMNDSSVYAVLAGGIPVVIGAVALVLGMAAGATRDPLDAPVGKVGAVLGVVAVVGGLAYAAALLSQ